jgi:hypothetical protein
MFETMASFMLVEHVNGAMFDPAGAGDLPADGRADTTEVVAELGLGVAAACAPSCE